MNVLILLQQPSECRHGIRTYKYSIPVAVFEKGTMQNGRAYVFSDVAVVAPDESSDFPARKFLFSTLVRVQSGDSLCAYERRLTAMRTSQCERAHVLVRM